MVSICLLSKPGLGTNLGLLKPLRAERTIVVVLVGYRVHRSLSLVLGRSTTSTASCVVHLLLSAGIIVDQVHQDPRESFALACLAPLDSWLEERPVLLLTRQLLDAVLCIFSEEAFV